MNPRISVVIVNYNRREDLRAALRSVAGQDFADREVIVVDNASTDGSREMLAADFPDVIVIPLDENRGMDGYSEGFRRARGEFIFQMDNDSAMPDGDLLSQVVARFQSSSQGLAVVATRVEEYDSARHDVEALRVLDRRCGPLPDHGFHSGGVAFRKTAIDRVGSYSREVFLYGSELFLQVKLLAAGFRIEYHPDLLMLHKSSPRARNRSRGIYYEVRNRLWFVRAWGSPGQRLRLVPRIILHDVVYGFSRNSVGSVLSAFRDGLGKLPADIGTGLPRNEAVRKLVEEVGGHFGVVRTAGRVLANSWRWRL